MGHYPESHIAEAANWAAHVWSEPDDDVWKVPPGTLCGYRYRLALEVLQRVADEPPRGKPAQIGYTFPCGVTPDGRTATATVIVRDHGVLGYRPGDVKPSFVWPPDLAASYRARQRERDAAAEAR